MQRHGGGLKGNVGNWMGLERVVLRRSQPALLRTAGLRKGQKTIGSVFLKAHFGS